MSNKEFITFKEAAGFVGVSSMTIRRYAFRLLNSKNPETRENVRVLNDKNPSGRIYKIAKDKVMSRFGLTDDKSQVKGELITDDKGPLSNVLLKTITVLEQELNHKQSTINSLLKQIGEYRHSQTQLSLLQAPSEKLREIRDITRGPEETSRQEVIEVKETSTEPPAEGETEPIEMPPASPPAATTVSSPDEEQPSEEPAKPQPEAGPEQGTRPPAQKPSPAQTEEEHQQPFQQQHPAQQGSYQQARSQKKWYDVFK